MSDKISVYVVCKESKKAKRIAYKISRHLQWHAIRKEPLAEMGSAESNTSPNSAINLFTPKGTLRSMREIEDEIILHAMRYCNNNYTKVSKGLGIARSSFYRRIDTILSKDKST